jgi:hypothetical protein
MASYIDQLADDNRVARQQHERLRARRAQRCIDIDRGCEYNAVAIDGCCADL